MTNFVFMNNQTTSLEFSHFPVMLMKFYRYLHPSSKKILDCTFGGGGYTKEILKFKNTSVYAIDRDNKVSINSKRITKKFPTRFKFYQIKFSQIT